MPRNKLKNKMSVKRTIITTILALALVAVIAPVATQATTISDMLAQMASLQAQLATLQGTPTQSVGNCTGVTFTRNLVIGSTGSDVKCLQTILNLSSTTQVAITGAGAPGSETTYFGQLTLAAVKIYQVQHGWTPANRVGPLTIAALNAFLVGGVVVVFPPVAVCPAGALYNSVTGVLCSVPAGLPTGCTSAIGFSITTGLSCTTATSPAGLFYTLNYNASSGGTIIGVSFQNVKSGESGTLVTATPNNGYYFANWSDGSTTNPRIDTNVTANKSVTANFVYSYYGGGGGGGGGGNSTTIINIAAIAGVTVPITSATPTATLVDGTGYTATISWNGSPATFGPNKIYTATITLTPKSSYTLSGVTENFFTVAGATATNSTNSGVVIAVFPVTDKTQLTISAPTLTTSKEYDGDNTVVVTAGALSGIFSPDVVTVSAAATYDTKNVDTGKTITVVYTLGGADATNYIVPVDGTDITGEITPLDTRVYFTVDATKVYDGNDTANVLTRGVMDKIGADAVALSGGTATYSNKNVANDKAVTLTGATLTGADKDNYNLTTVYTTPADITTRALTVTAGTDTKLYDGDVTSAGTPTVTAGALQGTDSIAAITQTFDTQNVGTFKVLTPAGVVTDGNGGNNYTLTLAPALTGTITAIDIAAAGVNGFVVPITGATPQVFGTLTAVGATYHVSALTWAPSNNPYLGSQAYTATVTLTSDANYKFPVGNIEFPTTDVETVNSIGTTAGGNASGNTLSYTVLFPATATPVTGDMAFALTTPAENGTTNTLTVNQSGSPKLVNVDVVRNTSSVVITGTKTTGQTVVVGGADLGNVITTGSDTAPIYTVNMAAPGDDVHLGGNKTFLLTVSEAGKSDIVYVVTVQVSYTLNPVTSAVFTTTVGTTTITITLANGTFKTGSIVASDFTFGGPNAGAIAANGTFTRNSDTIVQITGLDGLLSGVTNTDNTVTVLGATQATQVITVTATAS